MGDNKSVQIFIKVVTLVMAFYFFYIAITGVPEPMLVRSIFVSFILFLGFLKCRFNGTKNNQVPWYDWVLASLGASIGIYILLDFKRIVERIGFFDKVTICDWIFGILAIVLVLELSRRFIGKVLMILVSVLIFYTLYGYYFPSILRHPGIPAVKLIDHLFLTTGGLYGSLAALALAPIFMFIFFGAFIQNAGGEEFFTQIAILLTQKTIGGPAKAAVIGSALFGTISGSGVANVYATGSVTIPLMKKAGFSPEFAGAIEAVASTLGQLIPPVMGATAFLISEFSRKPYLEIASSAVVPSILYVFAIYMAVHFQALKMGMGIYNSNEQIPPLVDILKNYIHMLIPVIILIVLLFKRHTPYYAGTMATLSVVLVSWLRQATRMGWEKLYSAIEIAIDRVLVISATMLAAGIAVASLQTTGTPFKFSSIIINLSGGNLFLSLLFIAVTVIILGMGLPVSGSFLIGSLFAATTLQKYGISPFVSYMFVFMFALTGPVTPPVCMSSYAAASIADASFIKTGIMGFKLALPAYIIPFMAVTNPVIFSIFSQGLFFGILVLITLFVGIIALVISLNGYMFDTLNWFIRVILFINSIFLMLPHTLSSFWGLAIFILIVLWQYLLYKKKKLVFPR